MNGRARWWSGLGGALLILAAVPSLAQALPPGFGVVLVAAGFNHPTAFAFKGAQILVTEKSGQVRVVRPNGSIREIPFVTLNVAALQPEGGILGIALDPNFSKNKFVYIYYTTAEGALAYSGSPQNRVSRFTFSGAGIGVDETIIVDNIPSDTGHHNGGDIQFGFDGALYIAVGDSGSLEYAQTLDTLRGKILRVNPDGTSPPDNPYKFTDGARRCGRPNGPPPGDGPCKEIWAYGFRNPYRFSLRQANNTYVVGDVGESTWEELDTLVKGGNYGWSVFEGPCLLGPDVNCTPDPVTYPRQFQYPIHFYNHSGTGETGQSIIAGAFAENGSNYPPPYAGAYFYGDFSGRWVNVVTMDMSNMVTSWSTFDTVDRPVFFRNGPDGNLYVLSLGAGATGGALYKYVFTPP